MRAGKFLVPKLLRLIDKHRQDWAARRRLTQRRMVSHAQVLLEPYELNRTGMCGERHAAVLCTVATGTVRRHRLGLSQI
ncbi:hypothetical protein GCM10008949_19450 [Deinococcus humi]|nr:hypothetical protein GCM10008949_19450 [Deinococcus humi]